MSDRRIKVLLAKIGMDGHDRGVKVVASFLRQAGMEVIYVGMYQTPEGVVAAAQQEDVDVIGVSCLSNEHRTEVPRLQCLLRESGMDDVLLVVGGVMPLIDVDELHAIGIEGVFRAGAPFEDIVPFIRHGVEKRRGLAVVL